MDGPLLNHIARIVFDNRGSDPTGSKAAKAIVEALPALLALQREYDEKPQ